MKKLIYKKLESFLSLEEKQDYYCEVEYLESDGYQYIDTGIYFDCNYDMQYKVKAMSLSANRSIIISSYAGASYASFGLEFGGSTNAGAIRVYYNTTGTAVSEYTSSLPINVGRIIDCKYDSTENKIYFSYDDETATSYNTSKGDLPNTYPIRLFLDLRSNPSAIRNPERIYYCQIIKNGVLVRDFIPVLDLNYVPCLYDKVSGRLFYNQGTGSFSYGREIHEVEYLTADGNQYIDTGVHPSFTLSAEVKCQSTVQSVCPIGAGGSGSNNRWQIIASTQYYSGRVGNKTTTNQKASYNDLVVAKLDAINYTFTVNNNTVSLTGSTIGTIPSENTLSLFRRNMYAGSVAYASFIGNIYWCKIWENNVLIRDYVSAIDQNGVGFMFDKVTHTIFDNAGTGNFAYPAVELEYIESTGTQYIDTGIYLTNNHSVELDFQLTATGQTRAGLFGVLNGSGSSPRFGVLVSPTGSKLESGYGATNIYYQIEESNTNRHIIKQAKNLLYYDNSLIYTFATATFSINVTAPLGNFTYTNYTPAKAKYYSSKWWDNSTLVRDFIPVFKDGSAGFYDKVNDVFYANVGTGTFNVGKIK